MANNSGLDKLLDTFELVRMTGQDMADYKDWYLRRGEELLAGIRALAAEDRELGRFVDDYADCLADSVVELLLAQEASTAADVAIDLVESLAGQLDAKRRSADEPGDALPEPTASTVEGEADPFGQLPQAA